MDPSVEVAVIAAVPPTLTAIVAVVLGFVNHNKLHDVGLRVDGRLTELLDLTRQSSHAEGVKEEGERLAIEPEIDGHSTK